MGCAAVVNAAKVTVTHEVSNVIMTVVSKHSGVNRLHCTRTEWRRFRYSRLFHTEGKGPCRVGQAVHGQHRIFLIDFHQNWHRCKNPKSTNGFVWGSISHHSFPYFGPQNPHFRPRSP